MEIREKPGCVTEWPLINHLLAADERFERESLHGKGILFAPRTLSKLSMLLQHLQEQTIPCKVIGKGTHSDFSHVASPVLLSVRALQQIRLLEEDVVEVEAGCEMRTLAAVLLEWGKELGLDDWIGGTGKGTVGGALKVGCQSGLILRQKSLQRRLVGVELVQWNGKSVKLGHALKEACAGSTWEGVLTKFFFKVDPLPPVRLTLSWTFASPDDLWKQMEKLQHLTASWERLDCILAGDRHAKNFILAQLSGIEEEMEAFKRMCPRFDEASREDRLGVLKRYLIEQQFFFLAKPGRIEIPFISLLPGEYFWYHHLIHQGWIMTQKRP